LIEDEYAYNESRRRLLTRRTILLSSTIIMTIVAAMIELIFFGLVTIEVGVVVCFSLIVPVYVLSLEYFNRQSASLQNNRRQLRNQLLERENINENSILRRLDKLDYELDSLRSFQSEIFERERPRSRETTEVLYTILKTQEDLKLVVNELFRKYESGSLSTAADIESSEINAEKMQFVYRQISSEFAHSIKTPLASIDAAITNLSKILPNVIDPRNPQDEALVELVRNATASVELIRSILKQGAGFSTDSPEEIDLSILVRKAERICREETNSTAKVAVDLKVNKFGYYRLNLFIALVELLRNAFEAAGDKGHIKVFSNEITIQKKNKISHYIEILVINDGKVIPTNKLSDIFDQKYSTKGAGHGFGLKVVRDTLRSAKGNINVMTDDTKHTSFKITFEPIKIQPANS
jgi:signal transduction histidine kinase